MLKELGKYKEQLLSLFKGDENIRRLLLSETTSADTGTTGTELDTYIVPHLYVKPSEPLSGCYLYFDTAVSRWEGTVKTMQITLQTICSSDRLTLTEDIPDTYGLRYDILADYVSSALCPAQKEEARNRLKQFGIGISSLQKTEHFTEDNMFGHTLIYTLPAFGRSV